MPNRLIKESICTSDNLDLLTADEERFFYRLLVNCDDFGRFDGRPAILRAKLFPLKVDVVKESHIIKWLKSLVDANLIYIYGDREKQYVQMITWEDHQQIRAKRSKYPEPDSNGNHMIANDSICPRNPIQSESNPNPTRESNPTPQNAEMFEIFWQAYPKKIAKQEAQKVFIKLNPDESLMEIMLSNLELAKTSEGWRNEGGKYIPNPDKWLRGKRWEDEYKPARARKTGCLEDTPHLINR